MRTWYAWFLVDRLRGFKIRQRVLILKLAAIHDLIPIDWTPMERVENEIISAMEKLHLTITDRIGPAHMSTVISSARRAMSHS